MTHVIEKYASNKGRPLFICDFSPPRGVDLSTLERAGELSADFICVAYSPGKSVRVDSAVVAYTLKQQAGKEVIFNLACRDGNRLALQNHFLGAQMLGLDNVVVIKGDDFTPRDLEAVKDVSDFKPTELIQSIKATNEGMDYKGLKLRAPTDFCVGGTIDLGRDIDAEAQLTHRKVQAGADFFLTQAFFDMGRAARFLETYRALTGEEFPRLLFYGVQILDKDGLVFGDVPEKTREELEGGRSGTDIALEVLRDRLNSGITAIYLVPPILRGGRRDYEAAQRVLEAVQR